ncbi:MAG: alpha/beta hydrolase [Clostridia bacterium]|nr:alpha/beta hydrolase [Clostridia bacterium]
MELHLTPSPDYAACGLPVPEKYADLALFLLPASESLPHRAEKPLVLVCPGGAYSYCSDREAEPIAAKYLAAGFHAAVLRYHCAPAVFPTALLELAWSVKTIRKFAKQWHVNPDAVFVCGFSAGGHLAASLGTLWNETFLQKALGNGEWMPNGQILGYPVITMGEYTHQGSRENLIGGRMSDEMTHLLSLEERVDEHTVPTFLWHTAEDGAVPVQNSLMYAAALASHHVPFELHVFEKGAHGLSTCEDITSDLGNETVPDNQSWVDMSIRFIRRHLS